MILNKSSIQRIPPEELEKKLPFFVYMLISGGEVTENFENKPDVVMVLWNNMEYFLHTEEFVLVKKVVMEIWKQVITPKNLLPSLISAPTMMNLLIEAQNRIKYLTEKEYKDKKRVVFLKADDTGCGYWRMVIPARHLNADKFFIDVVMTDVIYDYLLGYDTIVVQRRCDWRQFYVIEKLKKAGKRIIYDIDDDILNVPEHNPASRAFGNDEKEAAKAIMAISDYVVTPSQIIIDSYGLKERGILYPNSLDFDSYPVIDRGSKDGKIRLLWAGSTTHEEDWKECIKAIDTLMMENSDLVLMCLGCVPKVVNDCLNTKDYWTKGRVQFTPFRDVETYISLMKKIVVDIAICPLRDDVFNRSKSPLKYVEYVAQGVPVVASNVTPYKEAIKNNETGLLASGPGDWYPALKSLIENEGKRKELAKNARREVEKQYEVKKNIKIWENIL